MQKDSNPLQKDSNPLQKDSNPLLIMTNAKPKAKYSTNPKERNKDNELIRWQMEGKMCIITV
ncbi:MAG: hypothetical protein ACYDEC_10385 [Bacteroidia bacterium]